MTRYSATSMSPHPMARPARRSVRCSTATLLSGVLAGMVASGLFADSIPAAGGSLNGPPRQGPEGPAPGGLRQEGLPQQGPPQPGNGGLVVVAGESPRPKPPSLSQPIISGSSFPPPPLELAPGGRLPTAAIPPWASAELVFRYELLRRHHQRLGLNGQVPFVTWLAGGCRLDPVTLGRLQALHRWLQDQP